MEAQDADAALGVLDALGEIPFVPAFRNAVSMSAADLGVEINPRGDVHVFVVVIAIEHGRLLWPRARAMAATAVPLVAAAAL